MGTFPRDQFPGRLLSEPVSIRWAGWESNTLQLQNAGWQLSAMEDYQRDAMIIALRHPEYQMEGMTTLCRDFISSSFGYDRGKTLQTGMRCFGREVHCHLGQDEHSVPWRAIDAHPQWSTLRGEVISRLGDLAHFATPLARTQEVIIPAADPTVDELLAKILAKQQPAREEYYRNLVESEGRRIGPQMKFTAQILRAAA